MKQRIKTIVKFSPKGLYVHMIIVEMTPPNLGGIHSWALPGTNDYLSYDGGRPAICFNGSSSFNLYVWGTDPSQRNTVIKFPKKYYQRVKNLIEGYNEHFKGE